MSHASRSEPTEWLYDDEDDDGEVIVLDPHPRKPVCKKRWLKKREDDDDEVEGEEEKEEGEETDVEGADDSFNLSRSREYSSRIDDDDSDNDNDLDAHVRDEEEEEHAETQSEVGEEDQAEDAHDTGWQQQVPSHPSKSMPFQRVDDDDEVFTQEVVPEPSLLAEVISKEPDCGEAPQTPEPAGRPHGKKLSPVPADYQHTNTSNPEVKPPHNTSPRQPQEQHEDQGQEVAEQEQQRQYHTQHQQRQRQPRHHHHNHPPHPHHHHQSHQRHQPWGCRSLADVEAQVVLHRHDIAKPGREKAYSFTAALCRALKRGSTPPTYSVFNRDYQQQRHRGRQHHTRDSRDRHHRHSQGKQTGPSRSPLANVTNRNSSSTGDSVTSPAHLHSTRRHHPSPGSPRDPEAHSSKRPKMALGGRPSASPHAPRHNHSTNNNDSHSSSSSSSSNGGGGKRRAVRATPKFPYLRQSVRRTGTTADADRTPTATLAGRSQNSGSGPNGARKLRWSPK